MSHFGLDIGSINLKLVQVVKDGGKYRVVAAGLSPTPSPGLVSESEKDLLSVSEAIKKLCQDAKISVKNVVSALPESEVFTRVIEMPKMSENELSQAIPWEAEQFVPIPLSQVTLDYRVVVKGPSKEGIEKMKVLLVAAPTTLIEKYRKVIEASGLNLVAIETEIIALARALVPPGAPPTMMIDLGAKTTDLAIVASGEVVLTRSLPTAGEAFTRAIAAALSLEPTQAEEYKIAYGMEKAQLEGKIRQALTPILEVLVTEVKKAIAFWKEKEEKPVSRIILAGGTANLPQVCPFLTSQLGIEVQIADPFANLVPDEKILAALRPNAPLFAVAVGLSEKEI